MARLTGLIVALALLCLVLIGASRYWLPEQREAQEAANRLQQAEREARATLTIEQARERHALRLQAEQEAHRQALARNRTLEPLKTALSGFWLLFPALLATGAGVLLFDAYTQRRRVLVWPSQAGTLPVERATVGTLTVEALQALERSQSITERKALAMAEATGRKAPEHYAPHVTYSPHVTYKNHNEGGAGELPAVTVEQVPSFGELLDSKQIGAGAPLLLGFGEEGAITGTWRDLYSSAVAGMTGSGKTTTTRFLACQSALHGARFLILDPHGEAGEESLAGTLQPLESAFIASPAIEERSMLHAIALVSRELDQRLSGKEGVPWVLMVDEFTALMARGQLADPLAQLIEKIAQEGRKKQVFALLNGQIWRGDRAGGTALRDSLASAYVHRIKRAQARFLLPTDDAPKAEQLSTGAALLYRTNGDVVTVRIPNTTQSDVERTARYLPTSSPASLPASHSGSQRPTAGNGEGEREGGREGGAREARVVQLLQEGVSQSQIIRDLYGVKGGKRYQEAAAEISAIIKANL